jgi:hypothetical protein
MGIPGFSALVTALLNPLFYDGDGAVLSAVVICYRFVNQAYNSPLQNTFFLTLRVECAKMYM